MNILVGEIVRTLTDLCLAFKVRERCGEMRRDPERWGEMRGDAGRYGDCRGARGREGSSLHPR